MSLPRFEVWIEGYLTSGMDGMAAPARLLGVVEAETFAAACDKLCAPQEWQRAHGGYDAERMTVWGCRLFDNEADARRRFG